MTVSEGYWRKMKEKLMTASEGVTSQSWLQSDTWPVPGSKRVTRLAKSDWDSWH